MAPDRQSRSNRRIFLDEIAWCFLRTHATVKQATKMLRRQSPKEAIAATKNETVTRLPIPKNIMFHNKRSEPYSKTFFLLCLHANFLDKIIPKNTKYRWNKRRKCSDGKFWKKPLLLLKTNSDLSLRSSAASESNFQNHYAQNISKQTQTRSLNLHLCIERFLDKMICYDKWQVWYW